ncbi:N-formylglutamate amidohydrolase [Bradyrhizobium brasilense]|uniref:N-formylglutamate amidohydrolase n=1 Tax=Bradyrhizobium brasilense TaxID=1419277 RepID=UPI0024B25344|nr:N-formylglutamate amidohydrolase [Bradyrhizobium australafricanum]WFU31502.1 N-formylglutamate amidohydrolase [Bradyrhizobium australafricanum]
MQYSETLPNLLSPSDPRPVELVNAGGRADFVLVCEHAGAAVPRRLDNLCLPPGESLGHIACDIGAEAVARRLADQLDAPLFLQRYSRLVVDCNRPFGAPDCIPEVSDGTVVPGNLRLAEYQRRQRYAEIHEPFHREVALLLDRRATAGSPAILVAVHSFTPRLAGGPRRPWEIGVLSNRDASFAERFLGSFQQRNPATICAHNQPYVVDDEGDYTIPVHGEARGLPHLLLEIRNDLICDPEGQRRWASLIADGLIDAREKQHVND